MKVKELKTLLNNIPEEFDNYDVIYLDKEFLTTSENTEVSSTKIKDLYHLGFIDSGYERFILCDEKTGKNLNNDIEH